MVRCPNCNHEELPGALFCSDCGAKIDFSSQDDLIFKVPDRGLPENPPGPMDQPQDPTSPLNQAQAVSTAQVALLLVDKEETIPLVDRDEFTLGRVTAGQPLIPEIDLSPFDAYEQGVSRLHAVIGVASERVTITDLGSANGTWLNGVRVSPHTAHEIKDGDALTLGKLKMKARIRV